MSDDGAKRLGERLLAEVAVDDLSSVLGSLRELLAKKQESNTSTTRSSYFNIPELDAVTPISGPPVLEILSLPPTHHPSGAGKTSLLYLIIAHAVLPPSLSSTPLDGQEAAIVLFDPLHHFSINRLAEVLIQVIKSKGLKENKSIDSLKHDIRATIKTALQHVHIFRPQSWDCLLATLHSLPSYLFDKERHKSINRRIHSIILEDMDAFTWDLRNHTNASTTLSTASIQLTSYLCRTSSLLSCATILTSHSTTPSTYRPLIPTSWPQGTPVTRLAVRRVEVLKFAQAISIEEAEAERLQRWDVVKKGRFECWKVGAGTRGEGEGFVFRVGEGVEIEMRGGGNGK